MAEERRELKRGLPASEEIVAGRREVFIRIMKDIERSLGSIKRIEDETPSNREVQQASS